MTQPRNGDKDKTKQTDDESSDLFALAMQGVEPLKETNKHVYQAPKPKPIVRPKAHISSALETHTVNIHDPNAPGNVSVHESLLFHQKGVRLQELTKLKKGDFTIQGTLDLHGFTADDADHKLKAFIDQAWSKRVRYLCIIHGKGYHSEKDHPILKNLVNQRLRQYKPVLAFCSAQPKDGGTGAVYVFLKAQ